jgi:diguanylate cyclase (GGDEF)-like protein
LKPRQVWPQQRSLWLYVAWGRLNQSRTAPLEHRADLMTAARRAVTELGHAANNPGMKAYHQAALADYLHLHGDVHRALRHLSRAELLGQRLDLPLLSCHTASTRAQIMRTLGQNAEATRQARHALQLASDCGWEDRARNLRAEFRISNASTGGSRRSTGGRAVSTVMHGSARRLAALQQVSLAAATILDPNQLARVALDETIRIFAAERAMLFLAGVGDGPPTPHLGRGPDGTDLDELTNYSSTLIEQVRDTGQPIVLTSSEQGAALGSRSVLTHGLRSVMIAPLQFNGELLGLVYLDSRVAKGVFTDDDVDILTAITNHVAAAMLTARAAQRATTMKAAERRSELADTMRTSMIHVSKTLDPDVVTTRLLSTLVAAVGADIGAVVRPDGTLLDSHDNPDDAASTELLAMFDSLDTPRFGTINATDSPLASLLPDARSWLAVPLTSREHRVGIMLLLSTSADVYHNDDLRVAAALAEQGMVAYDNAQLFTRAEHLASTDALTSLHNRRHFFDLAEDSHRRTAPHRQPLAAVMIDIDHFKKVNDTHGHGAGDDVIREVAARLRTAIRDGDVLGRYGGEEFALLLPGTTTGSATQLAERLRQAITATPIPTRSGPIPITISLGAAQLHEDDSTVEELLGRADHALYQAKQAGRNRVALASSGP